MNNVDMGTVVYNTLFSFSFSGILTLLILVGVCALWCTVPFAVFGVKKRLDGIEVAQRSQTDMLIGELKRINDNLRQRISSGAGTAAAAEPPPAAAPAPQRIERPDPQGARPQTLRQPAQPPAAQWPGARPASAVMDAELQAAMDEAERAMIARTRQPAPQQPQYQQPQYQQPQPQPPRQQPTLRPPPPAAPVSAAATMFGQRPPPRR